MRDKETMRLTLNAAETGHLVLATAHSGTATEALQRVVSAFSPEVQSGVCAQVADVLLAVVCQRLHYRPDLKLQVPECEVLIPTHAVKNYIRRGEFFKIISAMETGAEQGMFTYQRYQTWLESKKTWHRPGGEPDDEEAPAEVSEGGELGVAPATPVRTVPPPVALKSAAAPKSKQEALEIEPMEGGMEAIISKLQSKP